MEPPLSNFMHYLNNQQEFDFIERILISHKVLQSGIPNRYGCRIPIRNTWNLILMKDLIYEYYDQEIIDWLTYGFSISRCNDAEDPIPANANHAGALHHPESIDAYLKKEIKLGATMGPFRIPPYINRIGISPLSTREKRESTSRRVILDLSFPEGRSVNSGINKDLYCGEPIKLVYPTIDTLCRRVAELGEKCLLWKRDLQRFFSTTPPMPERLFVNLIQVEQSHLHRSQCPNGTYQRSVHRTKNNMRNSLHT